MLLGTYECAVPSVCILCVDAQSPFHTLFGARLSLPFYTPGSTSALTNVMFLLLCVYVTCLNDTRHCVEMYNKRGKTFTVWTFVY